MSYEKFYPNGWQSGETGGTPITPEALNHIENGIRQTYSDFAPAGYGLGESNLFTGDIDTLTTPGWGHINKTTTIAGTTASYWYCHVSAYGTGSSHVLQEWYPCLATGYCKIIRRKHAGVWEPAEYDNPPMVTGVEYRTTERCNGEAKYVKRISYGNLPASGSSNVSTGISDGKLVSLAGTFFDSSGAGEAYPIMGGTGAKCLCWLSPDCSKLYAQAIQDCSSYTGEFVIEYTKD